MSIASILQTHLESGRLIELPSLVTGKETVRRLIVTPEVLAAVDQDFPDNVDGERLAEFRQTLDAFSEHGEFSVAEDPDNKPPDTVLARVKPIKDEFWSFRVTEPEQTHGIRAFGAFVELNTFVVLTWDLREIIADFDDAVASAKEVWRGLFGNETPHSGDCLDDYLDNYIAV